MSETTLCSRPWRGPRLCRSRGDVEAIAAVGIVIVGVQPPSPSYSEYPVPPGVIGPSSLGRTTRVDEAQNRRPPLLRFVDYALLSE